MTSLVAIDIKEGQACLWSFVRNLDRWRNLDHARILTVTNSPRRDTPKLDYFPCRLGESGREYQLMMFFCFCFVFFLALVVSNLSTCLARKSSNAFFSWMAQ